MRRRDFNSGLIGIGGSLLTGAGCSQKPADRTSSPGSRISEDPMLQEARSAPPYVKPKGFRTGFDGVNMHQVMQVTRRPAVRVKLEMAGKPQAAQLPDGTIVVAGFIEPPVHKESRCTLQYLKDDGKTFGQPIVLDLPGRTEGFRALKNGALILGHAGGISRSTDGGKTWTTFQFPAAIVPGTMGLKLGECYGPIELPDGILMVGLPAPSASIIGKLTLSGRATAERPGVILPGFPLKRMQTRSATLICLRPSGFWESHVPAPPTPSVKSWKIRYLDPRERPSTAKPAIAR